MEKNNKIKYIIIAIITLVVLSILSIILWYNNSLSPVGKSDEKISVEIGIGSGTEKIANILKENKLIKNVLSFKIYAKLNHINSFKAGKYELTNSMDVSEIVQVLQTGKWLKEDKVKMTFVEGKTFPYYAKIIAENTNNTEEDVYNLLKDEEYLNSLIDEYWFVTDEIKNKNIYYPLEGYLFPDTYGFENESISVKEIFKTLLNKTDSVLKEYKQDIEESKYTVHEIISLASIVENETIFDKDRKDVSSVLYNRLKIKMSLGCDSTTNYAVKLPLGERELTKKEINTSNPYNTRGPNMAGKLPVGPICMPGKKSIEAAIYPNKTDYLYFVTDNKGVAYFTTTNSEHEKLIKELKDNNKWAQF